MKKFYIALLSLFVLSCASPSKDTSDAKDSAQTSAPIDQAIASDTALKMEGNQTVAIDTTKVLKQVSGDLDKDGIEEKIIVKNTPQTGDFGIVRKIAIYKNQNGNWQLWKESTGAVLPSEHGGMMGDPFDAINIEKGCIVIAHIGGSKDKWTYTHRYRFQNGDFYLIGASTSYGANCEMWTYNDFNLSTGKVEVKKENDNCEQSTSVIQNKFSEQLDLKALPLMDGFYPGSNQVEFKSHEGDFYY